MPPRRVTPLAGWSVIATFVLLGGALLSTVWSTRSAVIDASDTTRRGQSLASEQAVRAELADLEGPPTQGDLEAILMKLQDDGLRYIAMVEGMRVLASSGTAFGSGAAVELTTADATIPEVHGRLRLQVRVFKRMRNGGGNWRIVIEVEPIQANKLNNTATLTLGIGVMAAVSLLGVAIVLVRREARRNAEERVRERERRLASLGEMSAVLAHEIKNPLASLKGNAQLLAQMLPAGKPPPGATDAAAIDAATIDQKMEDSLAKARSKARRVVEEAVRLEQLTNDLLQFVRTGVIKRAPIDPATLVREAVESVQGATEVTVDAEQAPATWSLDAGRMREVVINLVDNALAAGTPARVTVRSANGRLVLEVADRGPGVPEDDRERIFEPFFTGKTQGTGLGLAVVRRVIEQHGGTIAVLTNPDGGALFRAEIPET